MRRQMEFRDLICELVRIFHFRYYMELGVKDGYTFNKVASMDEIEVAIGIDKVLNRSKLMGGPKVDLWEMATDYFYNLTMHAWKGDSRFRSYDVLENGIDLLFIDACHDFKQVYKDFLNYSNFVREGTGLILIHDTHPINRRLCRPGYCSDSWKLARLIRHDPDLRKRFEIVTLPGPYAGLSIIRKSKNVLAWREDF